MNNTSMRVQRLFDLAHFADNAKLNAMIADTMSRYSAERVSLADNEVDMLYAAGNIDAGDFDHDEEN